MTILTEGEVVVVLHNGNLVECTVISFYTYKGNELVVLKSIKDGTEHRRLRSLFQKPVKKIQIHSK